MDSLKEKALKAILNDEFTDEELTALLNHVFPKVNEAYLAECAKRKALGDAMQTIAHMDIVDGRVNDSAYSKVMVELEDMRNAWLYQYEDQHDEEEQNPIPETMEDKIKARPIQDADKPQEGRLTAEEKRSILAANAAKARAAKAKKQAKK